MAVQHDDFCPAARFRFQRCTCGAEGAQRIVDEVTAQFGEELKRIMARPVITDEEMSRPRFFPSRVKPPTGIENAKRIRARLS